MCSKQTLFAAHSLWLSFPKETPNVLGSSSRAIGNTIHHHRRNRLRDRKTSISGPDRRMRPFGSIVKIDGGSVPGRSGLSKIANAQSCGDLIVCHSEPMLARDHGSFINVPNSGPGPCITARCNNRCARKKGLRRCSQTAGNEGRNCVQGGGCVCTTLISASCSLFC